MDYCSESFDTTYNKKQHKRGAHGDGWKAPCGQKVSVDRQIVFTQEVVLRAKTFLVSLK